MSSATRSRRYRLRHKETVAAYRRRYYQEHKEEFRAWYRRYYPEHREHLLEKRREWARKNRCRIRAQNQATYYKYHARNLEHARDYRRKLRMEMLEHYGISCACCGETTYEFLSLDHINGRANGESRNSGGNNLYLRLRKQGWPSGYQVLCYNCNCAKGFWGECPHKRLRQ